MDNDCLRVSLTNSECLPIGPRGFQAQKKGLLSHLLYQAQKPFFVRAALEENICQALYFGVVTFAVRRPQQTVSRFSLGPASIAFS